MLKNYHGSRLEEGEVILKNDQSASNLQAINNQTLLIRHPSGAKSNINALIL